MTAFRLQKVLDLRRRREDELKQRLAAAIGARVGAEQHLAALVADEQCRREQLAALLTAGQIEPGLVQELGLLLELRGQSIRAQHEAVGRARAFEAAERDRLIAASVERKALDRLRERHEEDVMKARNQHEAAVLAEIAAGRTARDRAVARRKP